jgi:hypothetical protein
VAPLIEFDRDALIDWGAVAIVHRSLGVVIESSGLRVEWRHRPLEGGWLREVGIRLSTGRCAYLAETRTAPGEFTLHLVRYRDQFYFREDFDEVRQFLGLADAEVVVLTGQVRWWKKKAPAPSAQMRRRDPVAPPSRVAERVLTMTELADALKSHAGTFECEAIGDPTRTRQVAFCHLVTAPASNHQSLPSLGGLAAFFAVFGSVDLYHVEVSGESAKRIASPADWPALAGQLRDWLQHLAGPGRNDSLPDWVDDCLVVGEEPHSGNFLVVPCKGNAAGRVFTFAHDEFSFTEVAPCLRDFVANQIELDDSVLTDIATVLRLSEPGGAHQWWIRSAVDNRGRRARSLRDSGADRSG